MSTPGAANPLVVIVDDDEDDLFFLRRSLARAQKYAIQAFTNPQDALAFLQTLITQGHALPRAIFSDIRMPLQNGFEMVETIRATPELNAVRIAIVSGSHLEADQLHAKAAGANAYFVKHPSVHELVEFIDAPWSDESPSPWLAGTRKLLP